MNSHHVQTKANNFNLYYIIMEEIINKAREYALLEISRHGSPKLEHFELSYEKWQNLAKIFNADPQIVALGCILMDLKIGECVSEWKIQEHVQRSSIASQDFLKQFDLDKEIFDKIIACVESHHGTEKYFCKEAEICANADCYRFLHPRWIFSAIILFGGRSSSTDKVLIEVEKKIDEKYAVLSLDICKQQLDLYYQSFKKFILESKNWHN